MTHPNAPPLSTATIADIRPGDVIFFGPTNLVGGLVSILTWPWWPFSERYSHVGIVVKGDGSGLLLVESTRDRALGPCLWADVHVSGVQVHPLDNRLEIHRKRGGKAWRFPIRGELTTGGQLDLYHAARNIRGTGYDFMGAIRARDGLFGRFVRWAVKATPNGKFLFCNEAVAVILKQAGLLPPGFRPSRYNPKRFAAALLKRRVTNQPIPIIWQGAASLGFRGGG